MSEGPLAPVRQIAVDWGVPHELHQKVIIAMLNTIIRDEYGLDGIVLGSSGGGRHLKIYTPDSPRGYPFPADSRLLHSHLRGMVLGLRRD